SDGIGGWNNAVAGITLLSAGDTLQWKAALNANGILPAFTVTAYDGTNASSTPITVSVSVAAVNDIPTLSAITTLTSATEDTFKEITYDELAGAAVVTDVDGPTLTYRIESITAGSILEKWNGSAWNTASAITTTLSTGEKIRWKASANANGILPAFTVKAYDGLDYSSTAALINIDVSQVNDIPTLSTINTFSGTEDEFLIIPYSTFASAADEYDVETALPSFRIEAVTNLTTLEKWSGSTWENVIAGTTYFSSGDSIRWKAAPNAHGILPAFTVSAVDGNGASSSTIQVNVSVTSVNDAPTLSSISALGPVSEDNFLVIPYGTLASVSNIADVETPLPSFRIEGVTASTTLEKW
ncbi:MAG: hypothetical protein EBR09_17280, partial [Proteobacteria bacterium]|nr:hypothetical protein [Pseudomonadota bacterium]